jgi:membrane protein EpsK
MKGRFGRRQSAINTATTVLTFGVTLIAGVFFTPYLLRNIGPESYGLVMLAAVVVSYGSPLVQTLSATLARELAFARAADDAPAMQALLDRGMALCLWLFGALLAVLLLLAQFGQGLLGVSPAFWDENSRLLLLTGGAFLAWVLSAPFGAILYVANRLDFGNHAQLAQTVLRIGGAVLIIELVSRASWAVPTAAFVGALAFMGIAWWASTRVSPMRVSARQALRSRPLALRGTGSAVLISTIAIALLLSTSLPLVSHLADERVTGLYAAAIQIPVLVRAALLSVSSVFGPQMMAHFSEGQVAEARGEAIDALRWLGILAALPAGVVIAAGPLVLSLWLGPDYAAFAPVLQLEMVSTIFLVAALPMHNLALCADRVKWPSVVRLASAAGLIVLSLALFRFTYLGVVSVALALTLVLAVADVLFMAIYAARISGGGRLAFLRPYWTIAAFVALAACLTLAVEAVWRPADIVELIVFGGVVGAVHLGVAMALFGRHYVRPLLSRRAQAEIAAADQAASINPEQLHP